MEQEYLTDARCDLTFKNVLRNQPVSVYLSYKKKNKYKEHLLRPYNEIILPGKKVITNPYSKEEENLKIEAKKNEKYIKNYVKGHLKSNFDFKDKGVISIII